MITRFFIYGALGCLMEVLWTGLCAIKDNNVKMSSQTSLWMFLIYGMVIFLEPFFHMVSPLHFMLRGMIYAALIFAGEFVTGSLLKKADACPWDYSHMRYNVKGIISANYIPAWITLGLFYEQVYWTLV
ncbi:MAG: putative ABC transporter permease [Clostridiales bacterium]|nr:putative ABC transporter permease [Clostridiales bacterium]